jgi:hypothetical protein
MAVNFISKLKSCPNEVHARLNQARELRSFRQPNHGLDQRVIIPFGCLGPQKIPFSGSSS